MRISAASARTVMYARLAAPLLAFGARVMVGNVDVKDPFHAYRSSEPSAGDMLRRQPRLVPGARNAVREG